MKSIYIFILLIICTTSSVNAQFFQSGNITDTNNQTIEGRVLIDNSEKKVTLKKNGETKIYNFNSITAVTVSGDLYSKVDFNTDTFLANELVAGKASLYHLTGDSYLIKNGAEQLLNLEENKAQIPGILSILFKDCNSLRDAINKSDGIDERILIDFVTDYNNCSYNDYNPTETEISNANTHNTDKFRFYLGLQSSFNSTIVNHSSSVNTTGFGLNFGLAASPGFTGNLQGNIYFDFDVSMVFIGDNVYNNGSTPLNYKVNAYRFSLGLEYIFNKKGNLQPFLGIGYGYTADYYDGKNGSTLFKDHKQSYFFLPKVGVLYKLNNGNHIGLTASYLEYKNKLGDGYTSPIHLYIESSFINVGVNYYF